jgi:hypothetical protein
MKKKLFWLFIVALIATNVFFFTKSTPAKKADLKIVLTQARADGEIDPPGDEYPPTIPSPTVIALSQN